MTGHTTNWMTTDKPLLHPKQIQTRTRRTFDGSLKIAVLLSVLLSMSAVFAAAQARPQGDGMNTAKLAEIDALVNDAIREKRMPGAVVLIGHKGKVVFRKAYGDRSVLPSVEPMTADTIFDMASLTKVVATTTCVMQLVEDGKLRLNDTVGKFFPQVADDDVKRVTVEQMLTHTSGFAPDFDLREKWSGLDGMIAALSREHLRDPSGTKFVYSDINFETLGAIVAQVSGRTLDKYAEDIFRQAGMRDTRFINFRPPEADARQVFPVDEIPAALLARIAPTENIRGQQSYLGSTFAGDDATGDKILRGRVHDPTAYRMGGVAGHAGLFSTADDLARFCQMLLNGGVIDSKRILSATAVARMTAPIVVGTDGSTRGLGWDINTAFSSNRGELFPLGSFGHTGFTGTSIWIDRVSQTYVIFLSNRVHPNGKGDVTPIRAKVATIAASAVEDMPIEAFRLAEGAYWSQVAPQIPKFKERVERVEKENPFKKLHFENGLVGGPAAQNAVLNGIDILERDNFKQLDGMKIGLVTNQTGRDLKGTPTIDVLHNEGNVKLVSLFSPEHGIRGELDQAIINDASDTKTGLPVYSLYGETRRPKPEQLAGLDAIVYDIQDVGTRFYTYTATLRNVIEEAAKAKKPVYVLDRPDPINGVDVAGAIADEDKLSFIAAHTIPVRYGMTIGELALMINAERKIGADVRVIKMENWRRSMYFDETGQTWINPSPNMRSLTEAVLYPGIGLLETTNVSVGRGTDTPFELVGAPYIDGQKLAAALNSTASGVRFVPVKFTPTTSVFKGEECGGVNIVVTDRAKFEPVDLGMRIAIELRKQYPEKWEAARFARLLVNRKVHDAVSDAKGIDDVRELVRPGVEDFLRRRAPYLLYK